MLEKSSNDTNQPTVRPGPACLRGRLVRLRRPKGGVTLGFRIYIESLGRYRDFMLGTDSESEAQSRIEQLRAWLLDEHFTPEQARARLAALLVGSFSLRPETLELLTGAAAPGAVSIKTLIDIFTAKMKVAPRSAQAARSCLVWLVVDAITHLQNQQRRHGKLARSDVIIAECILGLPATVLTQAMLAAAYAISVTEPHGTREHLKAESKFRARVNYAQTLFSEQACYLYKQAGIALDESRVKAFRAWNDDAHSPSFIVHQGAEAIAAVMTEIRADWLVPLDPNRSFAVALSLLGLFPREIASMRWSALVIDPDWGTAISLPLADGVPSAPYRGLIPIPKNWYEGLCAHRCGDERVLQGSDTECRHHVFARVGQWQLARGLVRGVKAADPLREICGRIIAGDPNMNHCKLSLRLGIWNPGRVKSHCMLRPFGPELRASYFAPFPLPPS